jgi:hypothetical protein
METYKVSEQKAVLVFGSETEWVSIAADIVTKA